MCLQELFYGPYFCQIQDTRYYSYTEKMPSVRTAVAARTQRRASGPNDRLGLERCTYGGGSTSANIEEPLQTALF